MTTNCVFPPELEDKQLLAHLDDPEASPEITRHLENCPHCREKAESLNRLQKRLTARLYRATCPSSMELGEYHLRMLPAPQMLVVAQHVRECPHCTREVAELKEYLRELTPPDDERASKHILNVEYRPTGSSVFTPASAFRGESKTAIHIETQGIHIWVVDIQPAPSGHISIQCQVVTEDNQNQDRLAGALVELQQEGALPRTALVDEYGQFSFKEAYPGSVQFTIRPQHGEPVILEPIDIPM